jgi:hypothetical protein
MKAGSDGGGWESEGGAQGGTAEEEEERQCRGRRRARRGGRRREAATGGARNAARSAAAVAATAVAAGLIAEQCWVFGEILGNVEAGEAAETERTCAFGPVTKAYAGPGREGPASSKPKPNGPASRC